MYTKYYFQLGQVVQAYIQAALEAEGRRSQVQDQPRQHSKNLSQKNEKF